jgi:hypothetical protein
LAKVAGLAGPLLAALAPAQAGSLLGQSGGFDCHAAAQIVEQQAGLPPGLLLAIGRVETGRTDPATGRTEPWSWSTNMAGTSHYFSTEAEAIEWTAAQLGGVQRSIDVGCFQINLMYHPEAFETLEQAFDPLQNARYAAQFLISLFRKTGSWQQAAEQYHSADPTRGVPYGSRVMAFLEGGDVPTVPVIRASYTPRTDKGWVRTGPSVFGIQVFVPSWASITAQASLAPAAPASMIVSRPSSGGILVMMPGAGSRPLEEPRRAGVSLSPASASRANPQHHTERSLPRVFTPGTASNESVTR